MNGEGRRQLPSWMMRSTATEQANISETKGESKENGSVKPRTKAVDNQNIIHAKKHEKGVPLIEDKLHLLEKCETRTRKRKLNKHDKGQSERIQEDEPRSLKPCKESRKKRILNKRGEDRVDGFLEGDIEKKVDAAVGKTARDSAPNMKRLKKSVEESHNGTEESSPSEDEITVEDLLSIAEEYVKADKEKELQKSKQLEIEPKTNPQLRADSEIGSERKLMSHTENRLVTDQPLSSNSSVTKPLSSKGSIINPSTAGRDMLDLLLGHWLRKGKEVEKKTDAMTEKITLEYELSKRRNQNDPVAEVSPVMKKKFSLKEKVGRLLD